MSLQAYEKLLDAYIEAVILERNMNNHPVDQKAVGRIKNAIRIALVDIYTDNAKTTYVPIYTPSTTPSWTPSYTTTTTTDKPVIS